ncbi:MAG: hypothetical protein JKY48_12615 [Flavobacteriales bacterium]|nr:hypothetical protein [Flavobacteriales bacterium]
MNWEAIGAIAESLGAVGVILTLIYLATQIRQNTKSVRTAAGMDMSKQAASWIARMAVQPELSRIYNLAAQDPDSLTSAEKVRYAAYIAELFFIYEGQYEMYRQHQIEEHIWVHKRDLLLSYLKNPIVEAWWRTRERAFSKPYYEYLEELRIGPEDPGITRQPLAEIFKQENNSENQPEDSKGE